MPRLDFYVNYELQASVKLDEAEVVLGRDPKCAVQMPDPAVSRRHAVIYQEQDGHSLESFGSNGTRVNGKPVEGRLALTPGDAIFVSRYILVYQADDAPVDALDSTVLAR